ncbi:hypothetical protein NQZ68_035949 [Dissostichus eleginoides]|nr:hypothetical protein NQZ68_035949 [Dissostichus eleginoides]
MVASAALFQPRFDHKSECHPAVLHKQPSLRETVKVTDELSSLSGLAYARIEVSMWTTCTPLGHGGKEHVVFMLGVRRRVPLNYAPSLRMNPSPCTGSPSGTDVHQHKNNKGSFSHLATLKHNLAPKDLQDVIDYENNWQAATTHGVVSCSFAYEVDYGQYVLTSICQEKQREQSTHPEASLFLNPHLESALGAYTTAKAAGAIIQPNTKTLSLRLGLQSNKKLADYTSQQVSAAVCGAVQSRSSGRNFNNPSPPIPNTTQSSRSSQLFLLFSLRVQSGQCGRLLLLLRADVWQLKESHLLSLTRRQGSGGLVPVNTELLFVGIGLSGPFEGQPPIKQALTAAIDTCESRPGHFFIM